MNVFIKEKTVLHFGQMQFLQKLPNSYWLCEGDTLSVSLCPIDWWQQPGTNRDPNTKLYAIERKDGKDAIFLDLSRLTERNLSDIDLWASSQNLGSIRQPNIQALSLLHTTIIPPADGRNAILIGWAKKQGVDGIWFTDPISAAMPVTSRGGIFQDSLQYFQERVIDKLDAKCNPTPTWPKSRNPEIFLQ